MNATERPDSSHSLLRRLGPKSALPSPVVVRLLGNIAHDIRTPATIVRGYLRMLLAGRAGPISGEQREFLEIALNNTATLAALGTTIDRAAEEIEQLPGEIPEKRDLWAEACEAAVSQPKARSSTRGEASGSHSAQPESQ